MPRRRPRRAPERPPMPRRRPRRAPERPPTPVRRRPRRRDQASDACPAPTPPPRSGLRCLDGDLAVLRRGLRCLDGDLVVLRRGLRRLSGADLAAEIRPPMPAWCRRACRGHASDASSGLLGQRPEGLRRLRADLGVLREGPRWGHADSEVLRDPGRRLSACPHRMPRAPRRPRRWRGETAPSRRPDTRAEPVAATPPVAGATPISIHRRAHVTRSPTPTQTAPKLRPNTPAQPAAATPPVARATPISTHPPRPRPPPAPRPSDEHTSAPTPAKARAPRGWEVVARRASRRASAEPSIGAPLAGLRPWVRGRADSCEA
jgi:hypothetical protein